MAAVARMAVRRPHVLVVEAPGWGLTRMSAERELRRRGWARASSPAGADILLVCGTPGTELGEAVHRVWDQLPGPRVRIDVTDPEQVSGVLDESRRALLDGAAQREDAEARTLAAGESATDHDTDSDPDSDSDSDSEEDDDDIAEGMGHDGMDPAAAGHEGMGHDGMGHEGMDMDMPMPCGIGLAEGGTDRDGLDLDVLNLPLGPVLPHWPAGLVVRCSLQGDVVTGASVEVLPASGSTADRTSQDGSAELGREPARLSCAENCDHAAGLLALLGREGLAVRATRLRDAVLEGAPIAEVTPELKHLARRIRRSRLLRWSSKDLPQVTERLVAFLDGASAALATGDDPDATRASPAAEAARMSRIPDLITGLDIAGARLVVASLGLDTTAVELTGSGRG